MKLRTQVKICGINAPEAFDTAVSSEADWLGFNFFPPSPRYVPPATAAELSARCDNGPCRVGLFVDPTVDAIATVLATVRLDALQLYGVCSLPMLRERFGLPVWHAVGIAAANDLPTDSGGADRLLVEAKAPPGASRPGGNAQRFDWSLLRGWSAPAPWILAGGLDAGNVAQAIHITGATAVDVSSGVESARGVKDPALIRAFIANARRGDVVFRRATLADADELARVHVQAWQEAYAGLIPDEILSGLDAAPRAAMWRETIGNGGDVRLALSDGAIVAFGSSRRQRDPSLTYSGEITALYVLRRAQRCGVGRRLMTEMARDLLASGHHGASLWVMETNTPARRFYEAIGGREVAKREQQRGGFTSIGVAYGWDDVARLL